MRQLRHVDLLDRRRELARQPSIGSNPALSSALAKCTAFYHNTVTSGALASVPDDRGGAALAQASATFKPNGAAGGEISFDGDGSAGDFLLATLSNAVNNGSPRWGLAVMLKPSSVSGQHGIWGVGTLSGASASRMEIAQFGTDLQVYVYAGQFSVRLGTFASVFALNTRVMITVEYDGTQATDATKLIATAAAIPVAGVFTNDTGAPNAVPATLVQPTGTACVGERRSTSTLTPWAGLMGPWIAIAQPAASLSGGGIWTPAERRALQVYMAQSG
jgi:hypothetical protein